MFVKLVKRILLMWSFNNNQEQMESDGLNESLAVYRHYLRRHHNNTAAHENTTARHQVRDS